jgi:hypothetical protein
MRERETEGEEGKGGQGEIKRRRGRCGIPGHLQGNSSVAKQAGGGKVHAQGVSMQELPVSAKKTNDFCKKTLRF